jgi:hypothetical protein
MSEYFATVSTEFVTRTPYAVFKLKNYRNKEKDLQINPLNTLGCKHHLLCKIFDI